MLSSNRVKRLPLIENCIIGVAHQRTWGPSNNYCITEVFMLWSELAATGHSLRCLLDFKLAHYRVSSILKLGDLYFINSRRYKLTYSSSSNLLTQFIVCRCRLNTHYLHYRSRNAFSHKNCLSQPNIDSPFHITCRTWTSSNFCT